MVSFLINTGKAEYDGIAKFLLEINERWKNVSVELRCIQSLLEEVIAYWKKFLDLTGQFEAWLDRSFTMVKLPEEEKMNYFQVLLSRESDKNHRCAQWVISVIRGLMPIVCVQLTAVGVTDQELIKVVWYITKQ